MTESQTTATLAANATDRPLIERTGKRLIVRAARYELEVPRFASGFESAPYALLRDLDGGDWLSVNLLSSVDTTNGVDESVSVDAVEVCEYGVDAIRIGVRLSSSIWDEHETRLVCTPATLELSTSVRGIGTLSEVALFGGRAMLPTGACGTFRSEAVFTGVLVPAATEPVQLIRSSRTPATLGVVGDADPGRLNAVFSPPPLAFGLTREHVAVTAHAPEGDWLGLWLRASVDELRFTSMRYAPSENGFAITLDYDGHTPVDGTWDSPTLVLSPTGIGDGWRVLDAYRDDLAAHGLAPDVSARAIPDWWRHPMFCGWGAQCARSSHVLHVGPSEPTADTAPETADDEKSVTAAAASFARESVYDEFLARLKAHEIVPGTIVIDDRWQSAYGTGAINTEHWPDLKGWIAARHGAGQRVLLWWKAWDPEGIPAAECVTDPRGRPVSVDAGNQAYRDRLRGILHHLLSPEGLDADGLKIDFTQRGPSGHALRATETTWGIAAVHSLLSTLCEGARAAKPDALVVAHAVHPSFADVCTMVRLNDVSKYDVSGARVPVVDQLRMRHQIASRVLPDTLVDTDQWPMPNRAEWLRYAHEQVHLGVPALYYLEAIDRSGEHIDSADLREIAATWRHYREGL
ncbi:hypothetical protein SAMN04489806_1186 [Paramicrobacterium humi]|uniref:Alpha-galactosidase n=1 Tax=Paramicrobacterium humi TaxID=640635 RepID=A0A1H4KIQ9_9MICO|nr:hypothetical protein [Microbacterium humi]SEB58410.1 hypothetical protein SAMN04489806_1186 [Microbacterium humi]